MDANIKIKNNLRQARRRAGLERKQVAAQLGQKSTVEISRYERGVYLPNLRAALKLEIIYRMPVRLLFADLFERYRTEIRLGKDPLPSLTPDNMFPKPAEQLSREEFCFYVEILKHHIPNALELETVTKHVIALSNTISDYKQGRRPFAK